jgi:hypothetical protein
MRATISPILLLMRFALLDYETTTTARTNLSAGLTASMLKLTNYSLELTLLVCNNTAGSATAAAAVSTAVEIRANRNCEPYRWTICCNQKFKRLNLP